MQSALGARPASRFDCPSERNGHRHELVEARPRSTVFICRLCHYQVTLGVKPHELTETEVRTNLFQKTVFNGPLAPVTRRRG